MILLRDLPANTKAVLLLLTVVLLSRLPFLDAGYGADADAWKVARAADRLWHTGIYEPSRLPGNPLHEIAMAPMVESGRAPLANGLTLAASMLVLVVWYRLAKQTTRFPLLSTAGLAFVPVFWISSDTTIDYNWSLLFLLLALTAIFNKRAVLAGICLGVAVGFRPTNAAAGLPLLTFLFLQEESPERVALFLLSAVAVSAAAFSPLIIRYGIPVWIQETRLEMSDIHFTLIERLQFFGYRSLYSIGPLAAVCAVAILTLRRRIAFMVFRERDALFVTSLVGVVTYLLLFLGYPLERSYLLPAVPFLLILVDRLATRNLYILFACSLISFAFLNPDVVVHQGVVGTPGLNFHRGLVLEDCEKRTAMLDDRRRISALQLPGRAIVMTGGAETFWFQNEKVEKDTSGLATLVRGSVYRQTQNHDLHFVAMLTGEEIHAVRSTGYTVYCLAGARPYIERMTGLSMTDENVPIISIAGNP